MSPKTTAAPPIDVWADVIGQEHVIAALEAAAVAPVHAYLLVAPPGSGARQIARAFAARLLSDGLEGADAERAVRLALAEKHPDLHVYERKGAFISVDQIEQVTREAYLSTTEAPRKVMVLVDYHLVLDRAPRLLKTIEEPPESTIFVVLAEAVPSELVAIASRCVRIELDPIPNELVVETLVSEGAAPDVAEEIAIAAAGNLDRARLLAHDERFSLRRAAWYSTPSRLDGTGAVVWRTVAELRAMIDDAQTPLDVVHAGELDELEQRIAQYGERGAGRKVLDDRQKREVRRLRTDEVRLGLAALAGRYRDELASGRAAGASSRPLLDAITTIDDTNEALIRNPNETLLLQALLLALPPLS